MALRLVWLFALGGLASLLGWILAPAISIIVEVKLYRARKEEDVGGIRTTA